MVELPEELRKAEKKTMQIVYDYGIAEESLRNVLEEETWIRSDIVASFLESKRKQREAELLNLRSSLRRELREFVDDEMNWLDIENSVGQVGVERNSLIDFIDTVFGEERN